VFNQTAWFRLLCTVAFVALLWALYRYRLYQIKHEFGARLEVRVGERTRIARELHDTLLQSFQGLLLHLQVASELFGTRPQDGKQKLDNAIDQAAEAIREGGDAVQDLRSSVTGTDDVAIALNRLGQQLAADGSNYNATVPEFHVEVEAHPGIFTQSCGAKSTGLPARPCATLFGTPTRNASR
jgi:signal transduction histidine kinase